jgi:RNA-binding protein YlmH
MKDEERLICNRMLDMANNSYYHNIPVTTDFMDLYSQSLFHNIIKDLPPVKWKLIGGYELAERKIIVFYPEYMVDNDFYDSYATIRIYPADKRFSDDLNHRDFLGSVIGLGITRGQIGDIIIQDNEAILFCTNKIKSYILDNLSKIRHTYVRCEEIFASDIEFTPRYNEITGSVASLRLDAVISLGFGQSRSHLINYIEEGKIYVNGRIITSNAYSIKEGDIISIRGLGKIRFISEISTTKKGRMMIRIHKYI